MIGIGTKLYGFCNGFFGRDSYGEKTIEGIGCDWIVAREDNGVVCFGVFEDIDQGEMERCINKWNKEDTDEPPFSVHRRQEWGRAPT